MERRRAAQWRHRGTLVAWRTAETDEAQFRRHRRADPSPNKPSVQSCSHVPTTTMIFRSLLALNVPLFGAASRTVTQHTRTVELLLLLLNLNVIRTL